MSFPNSGAIARTFVIAPRCLSSGVLNMKKRIIVFIHISVDTCIQGSIFNCVSHFEGQK